MEGGCPLTKAPYHQGGARRNPMPFPKISPSGLAIGVCRVRVRREHEKRMEHVGEVLKRIAVENPTIATFLTALPTVPFYNDRTTLSHAIGFAINVYRLVEEEPNHKAFQCRSLHLRLVLRYKLSSERP